MPIIDSAARARKLDTEALQSQDSLEHRALCVGTDKADRSTTQNKTMYYVYQPAKLLPVSLICAYIHVRA